MRYILAAAAVVALIATVPASAENAMGGVAQCYGESVPHGRVFLSWPLMYF